MENKGVVYIDYLNSYVEVTKRKLPKWLIWCVYKLCNYFGFIKKNDNFFTLIAEENDVINVTVKRNNKEIDVKSKLIKLNDEVKMGVSIITIYDYDVSKDVNLKFGNKESGPSGGLMFTLSIYNKLVDEDITKNRKVVGTGTIDLNGNVGEIGGVKYKLKGAVKSKADIFICPYENYDEAINLKNKYNYDIEIIKVSTFDEAIEKLK